MADSSYSVSSAGITGVNPKGMATLIPVNGNAAKTSTALPANSTWSTGWLDTSLFGSAQTAVESDASGTYIISYSFDGGATQITAATPISYVATEGRRLGQFPIFATYIKIDYTNGATAQTKFLFKIDLSSGVFQSSAESLSAAGSDTRTASWTKSRIETKTSDATNDYAPIYRNGNAMRVYVDNPSSTTVDTSTLAKDSTLTGGNAKVQVTNFPANQPVSGSVAVTALPALPTGTNNIGTVAITANTAYRNVSLTSSGQVTATILDVIDAFNPTNTLVYVHFYDGVYASAKTPFWTKIVPATSGTMQETLNLKSAATPNGIIGFIVTTQAPTTSTTPITAPASGIYLGLGVK